MDPWLEESWGDVRHSLAVYSADQITEQLPVGFFARCAETIFHLGSNAVYPDPLIEIHVEIREAGDARPIAVIDFSSPWNKLEDRGRRAYEHRRQRHLNAGINTVDIDLRREGETLHGLTLDVQRPQFQTPYSICVRRAAVSGSHEKVDFYPISLRTRLPMIRIPVRPTDDVILDLQPSLDRIYERGRYRLQVDYSKPPRPPLSPEDATWAAEMVRAAQRSST